MFPVVWIAVKVHHAKDVFALETLSEHNAVRKPADLGSSEFSFENWPGLGIGKNALAGRVKFEGESAPKRSLQSS